MAILSEIGKSIGGLIFTLSLMTLIASIGAVWLTHHDNIKPIVIDVLLEQAANQTNITQLIGLREWLIAECNRTGNQTVEVPTQQRLENITIRCAEIPADPETLPTLLLSSAFDQIYYKTYECWFPDCFRQALQSSTQDAVLLMVTAKANAFFIEIQGYAFMGIVLGIILIALSVRQPVRIARSVGSSMIVTALIFILLPLTQSLWPVPAQAAQLTALLTNSTFAVMSFYVWSILVGGVVLVTVSIILGRITKAQKAKKKITKQLPPKS